jgi:hypothetical protein
VFGKVPWRFNVSTLPFGGIHFAGEIDLIFLDANSLLIISAALLVVALALFFITKATLRREGILTNWK